MKMKYIIIPTIVFNLVCLSIFISRQYKKYHTRKSNYIHYIETIKAKIIKEIENTSFYTSTDPEINISAKNILVFHFSMEACQPCLEEISETIKSEFPNYTKNKYIILGAVVLGLGLSSCSDYLNVDRYFRDQQSTERIFSDKDYTLQWLSFCYSRLQGDNLEVGHSDVCPFNFSDDQVFNERGDRFAKFKRGEYLNSVGGQYACRFRQLNVPGQIFMKALLDICPHSQSGERCKHSVERFDMLVLIKVSVDGYSHVCSFLSNRLSFGGG